MPNGIFTARRPAGTINCLSVDIGRNLVKLRDDFIEWPHKLYTLYSILFEQLPDRQGLGELQPQGARVLAPSLNPPHAQKTL